MIKKILILVNHDIVIYNFRKELVERLLAEGNKVVISSPYGERIENLIKMGCEYREVSMERHGINPFKELRLYNYYKKLIHDVSPDFVFTFTIKPNIYGGLAAKRNRVPYIANITGLGLAFEKKGLVKKLAVKLYKIALSDVQTIFFQNSHNMKVFYYNKINIKKHKLLPGSGVNLKEFKGLEYPPDGTVEFVFISRVMKDKGINEYLEAAKYITKNYPYTKFHICGFCEESYEDQLRKLQEEGVITYHGMLSDVREVLSYTHCTVHPTYHEGMSNVLLESAASERPVIATNIPGCKEIFTEGVSGIGFEEKSAEKLIQAIVKFLDLSYEERKKMGIEGRKKVSKEFDREIVTKSYIDQINIDTERNYNEFIRTD